MFAEYALGPLWEVYEGVSRAAASVGLKSKLFADEALDTTNGITYNKRMLEHTKIEATTPGMEWVVSTLQAGSATPSAILPRPGTSNAASLPRITPELQGILSWVGAGLESSVVSAKLRRYRPLSNAILGAH